jgi:CubicO group peptidase (beta-lactamase class C family)
MAAVVRDGQVICCESHGLADVENHVPMSSTTAFDLASCTKQFTAMAVMILHERGKLSFNDPVSRYLPELPDHDPSRPLRIDDLLHMTSGLADYVKLMEPLGSKTNLDVLHTIAKQPRVFLPGEKFDYSDTNYVMLAIIVERVSGRPFARFLEEEIFQPADMSHTVLLERPRQPVPNRAQGYRRVGDRFQISREDTAIFGDGQIMTTIDDMATWDRALRQNKLVNPKTLALATTSGVLRGGKPTGYGFGWYVVSDNGHRIVRHGGGWTGTSVHILRRLDDGLTVIVLSNLEGFPCGKLASDISSLLPDSSP